MIKVISGHGGPGGSTVAFNNLVNLFNKNGMEACLYTHTKWEGINCEWKNVSECRLDEDDVCIYHYSNITERPKVKKLILSCHETTIFPLKEHSSMVWDSLHYVSESQKEWQGVDGVVIPNIVTKYNKKDKDRKVAGVIGSIDRNKRSHLSIERALKDGHDDIRLYGAITDGQYFQKEILPLLDNKVSYRGIFSDMQEVYDVVTDVYHSPVLETFNLVKPECMYAGVEYHGHEGNDTKAEYWDDDKVYEAWKNLIST